MKWSRRSWVIGGVSVVGLMLVLGAAFLWGPWLAQRIRIHNANTPHAVNQRLIKTAIQLPKGQTKDSEYYDTLGSAYEQAGQYQKALDAYLQSQKLVTPDMAKAGVSLDLPLARCYAKLGDKAKARDYYQKEIDRIKAGPDPSDNQKIINNLQKLKDAL